ncbi:MAG: MerR family transcriptional regulator [Rubrivivax sp.]|nr:MerR family transcriptional regulator [Rubrivivax sp.]
MEKALPAIPAKRYFTIGEVSELCGVKPYVLRYWEQEFTQLKPMKRRGNRRYYQHHEVLLIRRIRELLYDQGFTISGARNRLADAAAAKAAGNGRDAEGRGGELPVAPVIASVSTVGAATQGASPASAGSAALAVSPPPVRSVLPAPGLEPEQLRAELLSIRTLLGG